MLYSSSSPSAVLSCVLQHSDTKYHIERLAPDCDAVVDADVNIIRNHIILIADVPFQLAQVDPSRRFQPATNFLWAAVGREHNVQFGSIGNLKSSNRRRRDPSAPS